MEFRKATRKQRKLRLAIDGPTGAGKTWTALAIASGLGKRIGVIDTENSSSELYSKDFDFEVLVLTRHRPEDYTKAIAVAAKAGIDVLIIDSLSHAWAGREGALEQVDDAAARSKGNSFVAWREVTPQHNEMVDAIIYAPMHVIATMRSKMHYDLVEDEKGKKVPVKIGMQPIQRDGLSYEFDIVADMDLRHRFVVDKTRFSEFDRKVIDKPNAEVGRQLLAWLNDGEAAPKAPSEPEKTEASHKRKVWERLQQLKEDLGLGEFGRIVGCKPTEVEAWKPASEGDAHTKLARLETALAERMARERATA